MSKGLSGLKPKTQGLGSNRPPRQPKRTFGGSDGTFVPWTGVLFGAQRTAQCVSCAPCRNADPSTLRQRSLSKGRWLTTWPRRTRRATCTDVKNREVGTDQCPTLRCRLTWRSPDLVPSVSHRPPKNRPVQRLQGDDQGWHGWTNQ